MIQSILFFIPLDLLKLIFLKFYRSRKEKLQLKEAKLFFVLILFFTFYVTGRIIYDYNKVDIRSINYTKKNLPQELSNLKITLISDIQADRYTDEKRISRYISAVNSTNPDIVFIAGDFVTSTTRYIEMSAEMVGKIKSKYGVYSCVGDHDNWAIRINPRKSVLEIKEALKRYNVNLVDNGSIKLLINDTKIFVSLITNTYVNRPSSEDLNALIDNSTTSDLKIFLTHQSSQYLINKAVEAKYDLFLSGHTHGGQITFLFPFFNLTPTLLETKYVRGDFWFGNMLMIVNRGLGMSLAPIRYNSTPEVTVITLMKN